MSDTQKSDTLRLALMHIGGVFTVTMAKNGLTPEKVAGSSGGYISQEELTQIMIGGNPDISASKLAYVAGQLNVPFFIGVNPILPPQKAAETAPLTPNPPPAA